MTLKGNWPGALLGAVCAVLVLTAPAWSDPYFNIDRPEEWREALHISPPHVTPLPKPEGDEYLMQWGAYLQDGDPYPPSEFMQAELYVWDGMPSTEWPEDSGLVMVWGEPTMPAGEYTSAWQYDYQVDPDLSNAIIGTSIFAPQFGPNGQINQVSFGIKDIFGNVRAWYWNVGVGQPIPWNALTTVVIDTSKPPGLMSTTPPATGFMSMPGFDITQAQFFVVDENGQWIPPALPIPPPGAPHPGIWNLWHDIVVKPKADLKWSQPPDPAYPDNVYYGWNEYSEWWYGPNVADDWVCSTPDPVTDIHWWGSHLNWKYGELPPQVPDHFHILIWTDVPADPGTPGSFSHPGYVVHEIICYNFTTEFVGWDYDPRTRQYEACFKYTQFLTPNEWFYQEPGPTGQNIYWVSISACYYGQDVQYPWGWKTRPRDPLSPAPDGAVVVFDPVQPTTGSAYVFGQPIFWPTEEQSWDMAFELTTQTPEYKWEQPPDLTTMGLDVNATWSPYILADDFLCTQDGPITTIRIWGSWLDDMEVPVTFTLSIHDDIPAGTIKPWSMPGNTLWLQTFQPGTYTARPYIVGILEGFFNPPDQWWFPADTICWLYEFQIPASEAFWQQANTIYWLDVQAYPQIDASFGWKTARTHWNDDAVWAVGVVEPVPVPGPWQELVYPPGHELQGQSIDLAFQLEGEGTSGVKWSQPPVQYTPDDAYNGWDEYSMYGMYQIAADDWFCDTDRPVTDIHWWGSFLGWYYPNPPQMPDAFHIGIWTDVPDPDPADPATFSHPGVMIWENWCDTYDWEFVGWDFDPRIPTGGMPMPPEATFKFNQILDEAQWFYQEPGEHIYWLSIAAFYATGATDYPWGWKTRPRDPASLAPDDAVAVWDPTAPVPGVNYGSGNPLWYPTPADSWDLAFELTTQPRVWCLGDMNCSGGSPTFDDIKFFSAAIGSESNWWAYFISKLGYPPPCPWLLGDYNYPHNGVEFSDIKPFAASLGQPCIPFVP